MPAPFYALSARLRLCSPGARLGTATTDYFRCFASTDWRCAMVAASAIATADFDAASGVKETARPAGPSSMTSPASAVTVVGTSWALLGIVEKTFTGSTKTRAKAERFR